MCRKTENGSNWHLIFPPSPPRTELHLNNLDSGTHTPRDKCVLEKRAGSLLMWEKMTHIHCQTHIQAVTDMKSFLLLCSFYIYCFSCCTFEKKTSVRASTLRDPKLPPLDADPLIQSELWEISKLSSKDEHGQQTEQRVSHELRDETRHGPDDPLQDSMSLPAGGDVTGAEDECCVTEIISLFSSVCLQVQFCLQSVRVGHKSEDLFSSHGSSWGEHDRLKGYQGLSISDRFDMSVKVNTYTECQPEGLSSGTMHIAPKCHGNRSKWKFIDFSLNQNGGLTNRPAFMQPHVWKHSEGKMFLLVQFVIEGVDVWPNNFRQLIFMKHHSTHTNDLQPFKAVL